MIRRPPSRAVRRRAATLVEFALVVPVFFIFFFGIVEVARGFMVASLLTNAARVGCRTATLPGRSNSDVTAAVTGALNGQGVNGTTTAITVNGASADVSTAQTGDTVAVTVSVDAASISWIPGARYLQGTIRGTYALPHE